MAQVYCSNCGKLIRASSNFCQHCGSAVHGEEAMIQKTASRPHQTDHQSSDSPAIPADAQIEKHRLCQRAVWSFFISYMGKTGVLLLLSVVGIVFEPLIFGPFLVVYILSVYITAVVVRYHYFYEVNSTSFRKEHGVIHKNDVTIPFNRIQNVNITRSLSDRILGLARIDVESAGSSATSRRNVAGGSQTKAEGHLPGVTLQQAEEIHDLLLAKFGTIYTSGQRTSP